LEPPSIVAGKKNQNQEQTIQERNNDARNINCTSDFNKQSFLTAASKMSKRSAHGTHVWVRTNLIESILHHQGNLPANWKLSTTVATRHGSTSTTDWGWARATVSGATSPSPPNGTNGFGSVKLRKTQQRVTPNDGVENLNEAPNLVTASIIIDDEEFAPRHLLYLPVSLTYDAKDTSVVCMANSWWFSEGGQPPEDLTSLSHLHEPAVVFCLQRRYEQDALYTYTGKILLALNPFRPVENIYGEDVMKEYWNVGFAQRPSPHVYAVAEDAYRSVLRSLTQHYADPHNHRKGQDQSILVSGESGAGKTVTTKIVMQYLATLSQNSDRDRGNNNSIEAQVLQSNPILESFGNARTIRNDNSSRFGKFIEIQFNSAGSLTSASITTYLLEKVRLIAQTPGERNYHIFYEILSGLSQRERLLLRVGNFTAYDFKMTAVSGTFDRRDGVTDRDAFKELREALDTVGFTAEEQFEIFRVCTALLHASNLSFQESNDASELDLSNPSLRCAVDLLGVSVIGLNEACCRFAIEARGETLYKNLSIPQAKKAIEALIKATYQALFTYIARRINSFITICDKGPMDSGKETETASIGVLDIFGFESFDENSFEQLCINFCNETLQQQFNKFVFMQEQDDYKREGTCCLGLVCQSRNMWLWLTLTPCCCRN
jgi:Myosin head (motor domain)